MGYKDIEIRKSELVAKTQLLYIPQHVKSQNSCLLWKNTGNWVIYKPWILITSIYLSMKSMILASRWVSARLNRVFMINILSLSFLWISWGYLARISALSSFLKKIFSHFAVLFYYAGCISWIFQPTFYHFFKKVFLCF